MPSLPGLGAVIGQDEVTRDTPVTAAGCKGRSALEAGPRPHEARPARPAGEEVGVRRAGHTPEARGGSFSHTRGRGRGSRPARSDGVIPQDAEGAGERARTCHAQAAMRLAAGGRGGEEAPEWGACPQAAIREPVGSQQMGQVVPLTCVTSAPGSAMRAPAPGRPEARAASARLASSLALASLVTLCGTDRV